jgi:hypothetical protein
MFSKLKAALASLAGGGAGESEDAPAPTVEYNGYRIRAAPYKTDGRYQTAGVIEKDTSDGVKAHRFVRADTHVGKEDAVAFAISKAKQIIDLQGDRMFSSNDG